MRNFRIAVLSLLAVALTPSLSCAFGSFFGPPIGSPVDSTPLSVYIGTTTGTLDGNSVLTSSGSVIIQSTTTIATQAILTIRANNGDGLFRVQEDGNVGVGTDSPAVSLDVTGAIRASGEIQVQQNSNCDALAPSRTGALCYDTGNNELMTATSTLAGGYDAPAGGGVELGDSPTWTGNHTWDNVLRIPNGSVGAPALTFSADPNTGIYTSVPNRIDFTANGIQSLQISQGKILLPDGTASDPSISFIGDADTGIFGLRSNRLSFTTGGVERIRFDASGNVGIDETDPEARLEVKAAVGADFALLVSSADASHMMFITGSGHMVFAGEKPELSSCGTLPEIEGTDNGAHIIVGTAESDTCTVTFAEPWVNKPICNCDDDTTIQNCKTVESPTTLILSGTWSPGDEIDFLCAGYR